MAGTLRTVAIVGAGPAGLYFSILMKKAAPFVDITVYERNLIGDTFGFGVVFSDQTLDNFERYDPDSYAAITNEFVYWDDIEINFKGTRHRIGGNGFCGCARRTLLLILHERAEELGVRFVLGREIDDIAPLVRDHDLVVLADGINSKFREQYREHFGTSVDLRPNKFAWMGAATPLDAFTFAFEETEWGVFIAHAYQYQFRQHRSTWVFETDANTFDKAGLGAMSEEESAKFMERIFARHLDGHPVLVNRSLWRNFPMIRNQRWVKDNIVLLGDAKSTAHFSIGAGTKLAMEDAIALYEAFVSEGGVEDSLAAFESSRRDEVERTQHSADVSLVFFEHIRRFWDFDPAQFAFGVMTRSKAITYDNLRLRAPDFVDTVDRHFAGAVRREGFDVVGRASRAADVPAVPAPRHGDPEPRRGLADVHVLGEGRGPRRLASRALRGARDRRRRAALHRDDERLGRGADQPRLHRALERRAGSGVEAHRRLRPPELGGEVLPADRPCRAQGLDETDVGGRLAAAARRQLAGRLGASPIPYYPESQVPRALTRADMDRIVEEFVATVGAGGHASAST